MPRFFHLADLHLGRVFHGEPLLEDQDHILKQVAGRFQTDPPDAVLLAGDLFDRAQPPVDAMRLLDGFFTAASSAGVTVVAIPGNHDSPGRLSYAAGAWESRGVHIRTDCARLAEPVRIQGRDGGTADVFAFPFVEPAVLRTSGIPAFSGGDEPDKAGLIRAGMELIRSARTAGRPAVILAHEFVAGSQESGSERLYVGGSQAVPADLYRGFDYVALGHIHGPQSAGDQFIRYCGSPMAYAFDEAGRERGYIEVILDTSQLYPEVKFHKLTPLRPLEVLEDSLDRLLNHPAYSSAAGSYVSARVTDALSHLNLIGRLRERFPWLRELRQTALEPAIPGVPADPSAIETPDAVFRDFLDRAGWEPGEERDLALSFLSAAGSLPEEGA